MLRNVGKQNQDTNFYLWQRRPPYINPEVDRLTNLIKSNPGAVSTKGTEAATTCY